MPCSGYFPVKEIEVSLMAPDGLASRVGEHPQTVATNDIASNRLKIPRSTKSSHVSQHIDIETALQYGIAQGYPPLYAWLRKLTTMVYHPNIPYSGGANIIVSGGAADGLAKVFDVFFNAWDEDVNSIEQREGLLVEEFTYPAALAQVRHKDVNIVSVKMDSEGMLADGVGGLSDVLKNWESSKGKRPHMLYIVPYVLPYCHDLRTC